MDLLNALLLLIIANAAPVVMQLLLRQQLQQPVDGGWLWFDQRPLFGRSKTLRGILSSLLTTAVLAELLGYDWPLGIMVGAAAMVGDLLTSFIKRRLNRPSSEQLCGFDQLLETLLPLLVLQSPLGFSNLDLLLIYLTFTLIDLVLTRWLFSYQLRSKIQAQRR